MPMFWSKKSKSEKNYEQASSSKGSSAKGAVAKPAYKGAKKAAPMFAGMQAAKGVEQTNKAVAAPKIVPGNSSNAASIIIRPHITEKSGLLSQSGVYTFQISENATKSSVAKAMAALYNVTPVRVAMINLPAKKVFVRGKRGVVSGIRKAMVTVKSGEKIDFV